MDELYCERRSTKRLAYNSAKIAFPFPHKGDHMKRKFMAVGCLSLLFIATLSSGSFADVTNFSANVFGTVKGPINCQPVPNPCEFLLSGPNGESVAYTGFNIAGISSTNPAKIVAIEGTDDRILIQDALITATAAGQAPCSNTAAGIANCPTITYSANFASPPTTASGDVVFVRSVAGTFMRGANPASNSAVKIRGVVATYQVGTDGWKNIGASANLYSAVGPNEIYDRSQIWYQNGNPALPDPRPVSGTVWVYARAVNDVLTLSVETVRNPTGGQGPKIDCAANEKPKKKGKHIARCAKG